MSNSSWDCDCAVIGGGPGGLVSALYLKRFRRSVVLINHGKPRAAWIPRTHNLLAFPRGLSGRALLARLGRQNATLGLERINSRANVVRHRDGFRVELASGREITARKVILATGIEDLQPPLKNLSELRERGLLRYCPVCDAFDFRDQKIAVLAHDRHGVEKALFLATYSPRICVVVPPAYKIGARSLNRIRQRRLSVVCATVVGMERAIAPHGVWTVFSEQKPLFSHVVYPMLGTRVQESAFERLTGLDRTRAGFVHTTSEQRTSIDGLFAVGDCVGLLAQINVAAGQAAVAATAIHDDLL